MIEIINLHCRNLYIESLVIPDGPTFVRGKNGAGKTTFLEIASGLRLPDKGSILIDCKSPREIPAGYVSEFPSRSLLFAKVSDEISSSLRFAGLPEADILRETKETADIFGISHLLHRDCRTLSGGEKVLTAAAAAAAGCPKLIVLDEPDSHLDEQTAFELLNSLLEMNIPHILWASHRKFAEGFEVVL